MQLAQALTRAESEAARTHIRAAISELTTPTPLVECAACGRAALPARMICTHCAE